MQNLIDPAILFFIFGVLAGTVKSNLEIPPAISRFLSLYLLMALGLKGGFALSQSGMTATVGISLAAAVFLAIVIPLIGYAVLRRFVSGFDAAAVAATYGSVSAVTFVTAVQTLENQGVPYGGHMAAAMALMESPAIILAVVLANSLRQKQASSGGGASGRWGRLGWTCCASWRVGGQDPARVFHRRCPVAALGGHGDWPDHGRGWQRGDGTLLG